MFDPIDKRLRDQERALLACALAAPGGAVTFDEVSVDAIVDPNVRIAWRACQAAVQRGARTSPLLLAGAGLPDAEYDRLHALTRGATGADPMEVRDEYRIAAATHRLAYALATVQGALVQPDVNPAAIALDAEAALRLAVEGLAPRRRQSLIEAGEEYVASLRAESWRVPLPRTLDERIGGLAEGQMLVVLGRSGHGKSCLALTAAVDAAREGRRVLFVSREMPAKQLAGRMAAMIRNRTPQQIRDDVLTDQKGEDALYEALDQLGDRIVIDDRSRDIRDVEAEVRRARLAGESYALVVLDFVQQFVGPGEARHEVLEAIAYAAKDMAMRERCAVIAPAQVNRAGSREEAIPGMNSIRGSSGIENAADAIVGIVLGQRDSASGNAKVEACIAKARNGTPGALPNVLWLRANLRVEENADSVSERVWP
jgi:hypothetical protein